MDVADNSQSLNPDEWAARSACMEAASTVEAGRTKAYTHQSIDRPVAVAKQAASPSQVSLLIDGFAFDLVTVSNDDPDDDQDSPRYAGRIPCPDGDVLAIGWLRPATAKGIKRIELTFFSEEEALRKYR